MRQLENVSEELAAAYFSSREVVAEKFGQGLSGENPYWEDEQAVASLSDHCIRSIVRCFSFKPNVSARLRANDRQRFLALLSLTEDIRLVYDWLEEGLYWKRRCQAQYPTSDVARHGGSWKRMCVEQTLRVSMETFRPLHSDMGDLREQAEALGGIVEVLELSQLMSPTVMVPAGQGVNRPARPDSAAKSMASSTSDLSSRTSSPTGPAKPDEIDMTAPANHLDFSMIIPLFPNLTAVRLCFQVKKCGIEFRWNMFGMTEKDADNLAAGLGSCPKLHTLSIRNSKLTDTLLYDVMGGMEKLVNVTVLDFPNNILTDECVDVLTKAMANKSIKTLNLCNNKVSNEGAKNLAVFIAGGKSCLEDINLSLNLVEDEGSVPLLKAISLDRRVSGISLSSNRLGPATCQAVKDLLTLSSSLLRLDLSCNKLTEEGGSLVLQGLKQNTMVRQLDLRLTGVAKQVDIEVQATLQKNSGFK